jgi:hypothetical protein
MRKYSDSYRKYFAEQLILQKLYTCAEHVEVPELILGWAFTYRSITNTAERGVQNIYVIFLNDTKIEEQVKTNNNILIYPNPSSNTKYN